MQMSPALGGLGGGGGVVRSSVQCNYIVISTNTNGAQPTYLAVPTLHSEYSYSSLPYHFAL